MTPIYAHATLLQAENTLDVILDIISEGIWDWNTTTGHVHRSSGWYKMLAYDINCFDANVTTWENVIHPEDYNRVMEHFQSYITGKIDFYKIKYRCKKGNGTYLWIEDSGKIVERDKNGTSTRMIGAHTDINEIEIAQQKLLLQNKLLRADNASLEVHIEKVVEDIHKKDIQLLEQSRLAQMGEMISMIAHQWRQPLNAIASISIDLNIKVELDTFDLKQDNGRKKFKSYLVSKLKDIERLVKNLTTTIDDFRNFYKPNKQIKNVKLEAITAKALNIIKASLSNENIEVIEEYNSKQEIGLYDNEMMQVILNILKNAQDNFIEKQTKNPYIKITTENRSIIICDNGGGIAEDMIGKIFDPYFSTKDAKNGTGLGLYMSKIIVEDHHNGKLDVENTADGVCFIIELGLLLQERL